MKTRVLIVAAGVLLGSWMTSAQTGGAPQASQDRALIDEVVVANHILANEGVLDAYGHVSVRDERNPNHFYLARSKPPGVITRADIVEYDFDSKAADGNDA